MEKTSGARFLPRDPMLIIRKCLVEICGCVDTAMILAILIYWQDIKDAVAAKNKKENDRMESEGKGRPRDEGRTHYHTTDEFMEGTFDLVSRNRVIEARKLLREKGYITEHSNLRIKSDRTKHFQVNFEVINNALDNLPEDRKSRPKLQKKNIRSSQPERGKQCSEALSSTGDPTSPAGHASSCSGQPSSREGHSIHEIKESSIYYMNMCCISAAMDTSCFHDDYKERFDGKVCLAETPSR